MKAENEIKRKPPQMVASICGGNQYDVRQSSLMMVPHIGRLLFLLQDISNMGLYFLGQLVMLLQFPGL